MQDAQISRVMAAVRRRVGPLDTTPGDPFAALVACLISLRTRDEVTGPASERLLSRAPDAAALAGMDPQQVARLIFPAGFYRSKARTLVRLAGVLLERHGGRVPESMEDLLALKGVGRKTANLVLARGFGEPAICVDTHVHRIFNRLGYVRTRDPEATEMALRAKLPRRHWLEVNGLLVRYGQQVCTPLSPRCSGCPVVKYCERVGVTRSR
jgi:endonuclease-3